MARMKDWSEMRARSARLLEQRTGKGVAAWNARVRKEGPADERRLATWLGEQGVTGYAQSLLVMERFGYPDWYRASAKDLVDGQYADRPGLRPVFDAVVRAAEGLGDVVVQARKTFVALVAPRRTFARVHATTKDRVDLGLRLDGQAPVGRLRRTRLHETTPLAFALRHPRDVDAEVKRWMKRAYEQSA
jgi:hypothetical protein